MSSLITHHRHVMCLSEQLQFQRFLKAEAMYMRQGFKEVQRDMCAALVVLEANRVTAALMLLAGHLGGPINDTPYEESPEVA